MSKSYLLSPSVNLVEHLCSYLEPGLSDYSDTMIVFPGRRPGYAIRKFLAEREQKGLIPPVILSIDEFIDVVFRESLERNEPESNLLDSVAMLYELHCSAPERIGDNHFTRLDDFLPLGVRLFSELEELQIAGRTAEQVRNIVGQITFGKLHTVPPLFEKFYSGIRERGWVTRGMKYHIVADEFSGTMLDRYRQVLIAGFFALTGSEQNFFTKLLKMEKTLFFFQDGKGIDVTINKLEITPQRFGDSSHQTNITYIKSPDTHGQVFSLTAKLGFENGAPEELTLDENTVIVLPMSGTLFPVLQHTLSLLPEESYNVSMGYPITRTPMYSFYHQLLRLIETMKGEKLSVSEYIKFMLHPYVKNILFGTRAEVTRILIHVVEEHFFQQAGKPFFTLSEIEQHAKIFENVARILSGNDVKITGSELQQHLIKIHRETIGTMAGVTGIGNFADRSIQVLNFIYDQSTARKHPYFYPYADMMLQSIDALRTGLLAEKKFERFESYAKFVRNYLKTVEVHFPGTPLRGLQTLGFLETRNLKFKRVFMLDVNDDVLPGVSDSTQMLLPQQVREKLGLETMGDRERLAEYYVDVLIGGSDETCLFFIEDRQKKEPSRFIEKRLWQKQQEDRIVDKEQYIHSVSYRLSLKNQTPAPIAKTKRVINYLKGATFTATSIDTYMTCGLKFYYKYVLKLSEKEEVTGEVEQREIGDVVHETLKEFFEPYVEKPIVPDELNPVFIKEILRKQFSNRFGEERPGNYSLIQFQIEKQLGEFLTGYQIPMAKKQTVKILKLEERLESRFGAYKFVARVDRIEERGRQIYILDYKTGAEALRLRIKMEKLDINDRTTWGEAIGSMQLPLYAFIYAQKANIPVERIAPAFLFLGQKGMNEKIERALFDEDIPAAKQYDLLRGILEKILDEITAESIPFQPTESFEKDCPHCPFTAICGTGWVRGWQG